MSFCGPECKVVLFYTKQSKTKVTCCTKTAQEMKFITTLFHINTIIQPGVKMGCLSWIDKESAQNQAELHSPPGALMRGLIATHHKLFTIVFMAQVKPVPVKMGTGNGRPHSTAQVWFWYTFLSKKIKQSEATSHKGFLVDPLVLTQYLKESFLS